MTLQELLPVVAETPIGSTMTRTVRGRDVHAFLEVRKDYSDWIKVQVDRARLQEGRDYVIETGAEVSPKKGEYPLAPSCAVSSQGVSPKGGRPRTEYHLTLEAAKHVGMMSGMERGYQLREYFLECERRATAPAVPTIPALPQTFAEALQLAADQQRQVEAQAAQIAVLAPRSEALAVIADAEGACNVTVAAKTLQMPPGELWTYLRRERWVYKRDRDGIDVAMQTKIDAGYLTHKTVPVDTGSGRTWLKQQVMVTPKGLTALAMRHGKSLPAGALPLIENAARPHGGM